MANPFTTTVFTAAGPLAAILHRPEAPAILDLRVPQDARADPTRLPAARRLSLADLEAGQGPRGPAIVYCQRGGKIRQLGAAVLRARGVPARALTGGHLGWVAAGLPVQALDPPGRRWILSLTPGWAQLAALWTLRRLVDPGATVLPVAADQIEAACAVTGAAPLPATARAMADLARLSHPLPAALGAALPRGADALLSGRLARDPDPDAALDLLDDLIAGAGLAA